MQTNGGSHNHQRASRSAVFAYLESPDGSATPVDVGGLLVHLDWAQAGCEGEPSAAQIHQTRLALEDVHALVAAHEATELLAEIAEEYESASEPSGVFACEVYAGSHCARR